MGSRSKSDVKLMPTIEMQGQTVHYSVRKSKRAKRISLRFHVASGFQVVYPLRVQRPKPAEVFMQKQAWVLKALEQMRAWQQHTRYERRYEQGARFPFFGENLTLNLIEREDQDMARARRSKDRLDVKLAQAFRDDTDVIRAAIENYYRYEAKQYLPLRVKEIADRHGFVYKQIRIKNQRTVWGSCSAKRNLNFNMRLMMTPPAAIDSVIIHELCHLRVMNHSNAFWELVEKLCPDYREWRKWFKENQRYLVF